MIGFACAELVTLLFSGRFIQLEDWRQPHYIHNFSDLVENLGRSASQLWRELRLLSPATLCLCAAGVLYAGWKWFRGDRLAPWSLILLLLVAASAHAQALPVGIIVSTRSAACLFLAVIALVFFSFRDRKPLVLACAIFLTLPLYEQNVKNIEFVASIMRVWTADLEKIPVGPQNVEGIVLLSSPEEAEEHEQTLGRRLQLNRVSTEPLTNLFKWVPAPYELGFRRIAHGLWDRDYLTKLSLNPDKVERFERCGVYEYAVQNGWLLVRFVR